MKLKKQERKEATLLHKQENIDHLQQRLATIDEEGTSKLLFPTIIKRPQSLSPLDILMLR